MYYSHEAITLKRDCDAILIPSGEPITLQAGSLVYITQALGDSCTVYIDGNLARIAGRDLDALGLEPVEEAPMAAPIADGSVDESLVWAQMRTCYDPEIPVNIVDLGLIYDCTITPLPEGGNRVEVRMTLTAPGCGIGQFLVEELKNKIKKVPNVTEVNIELVFDPPWNPSMMSEAARLEMGMF